MESTGLFLQKEDVRPGMVAALALARKGDTEPTIAGSPQQPCIILKAFDDEMNPGRGIKLLDANSDGTLVTNPDGSFPGFTRIANAAPDARFMPVKVFTLEEVPPYTECVAILHGHVLPSFPDERKPDARIITLGDGVSYSASAFEQGEFVRYPLPRGVILVPVCDIGAKRPR